jgi:cytochrome c6
MTFWIKMLGIRSFKPTLLAGALFSMCGAGLSHAADTNKGAGLYATHCASCHGVSGISVMVGAPNFAQNERLMSPDIALLISIRNGKAAMPAFRGALSDQDILNVVAYLRTLH